MQLYSLLLFAHQQLPYLQELLLLMMMMYSMEMIHLRKSEEKKFKTKQNKTKLNPLSYTALDIYFVELFIPLLKQKSMDLKMC